MASIMSRRPSASPRLPFSSRMQDEPSPSKSGPAGLHPGGTYRRVDYSHVTRSYLRRPAIYLPTLAFSALVLYLLLAPSSHPEQTFAGYSSRLHESLDKLDWRTHPKKPTLSLNAQGFFDEFACNPFASAGRLHVDEQQPTSNIWTPFDRRCRPSNYLSKLYRPEGDVAPLVPARGDRSSPREFLPWLMNKTVVIHGDSIDRFHLKDFCTMVGGQLTLITPDHPASPKPYRQAGENYEVGMDGQETQASRDRRHTRVQKEQFWEGRPKEGWELTNPWVCDIEEYGATLINVFTWGLQGAEEFFETERWYHPPATWVDRLSAITMPLLEGLAKAWNRPQIMFPDLVELNSGFWDLRKYTEEDFVAAGYPNRPYPEDSPIPYTNLSPAREKTWEREARRAIKEAARSFRGRQDGHARSGPTLLWRSLHHPPRHNYAPFPRVFALDSLARHVISDLIDPSSAAPSSTTTHDEPPDTDDLGLDERLRIDESGALMLGQEHHFRDLLHPMAVPGSYLWGNVMLYELKRAVLRIGRS